MTIPQTLKTATEGPRQEKNSIKEIGNSIRMNFFGVYCVREFFAGGLVKKYFYSFSFLLSHFDVFFFCNLKPFT